MHPHIGHRRRPNDRRDDSPAAPTAIGVSGASVAQASNTANTLALNSAAPDGDTAGTVVSFSASATQTITSAPDPAQTSANPVGDAASGSATPTGAGSQISMGTVIGACLGALAGAILIILVGLWLYKRGTRPRRRSPSNSRKAGDKERTWAKMDDDNEDKWQGKYQQKGVVSTGPTMEKLTMFKSVSPSIRSANDSVEPFSHPFASYHPNQAKQLAEDHGPLTPPSSRPFLARVDPVAPISWDGDTVGRDSFLSLSSNTAARASGNEMALPTPQLTSSEPHHWQSAVVMDFDPSGGARTPRGRSPANDDSEPRRKSGNNPFFGASSRISVHSTHSTRSRSRSHSRTRSRASSIARAPLAEPEPPVPTGTAYTREEKGKYRAVTPPSPTSTRAPSTIIHNPFSDPAERDSVFVLPTIVPHTLQHFSQGSQDRAMASLLAALGPGATVDEVHDRLRVASMNPSVVSVSEYTEGDTDTLHQSWPVPPSRPAYS